MFNFLKCHNGTLELLGTIFFGVLSIYFYFQQREFTEISYTKSTVKIVESDDIVPSLQIIRQNGESVKNDVFVTELVMWNSGTLPISDSIVRQPIALSVLTGSEIIDARVVEENHPNLSNFVLSDDEDFQI